MNETKFPLNEICRKCNSKNQRCPYCGFGLACMCPHPCVDDDHFELCSKCKEPVLRGKRVLACSCKFAVAEVEVVK